MTIKFYSKVFDREFTAQEIDRMYLEPLYLLIDELSACKKSVENRWKRVPKKQYDGEQLDLTDLIEETRTIETLYLTARRRAHYINEAKVTQLLKGVTSWKKKAFYLGKQLGLTQDQVKEIHIDSV